ncbi:hypothetical protein D3C72_2548650 [compost metagenome]
MRGGEHPKDHRAFGNEPAAATGKVAFADLRELGDPRIGRVLDDDQRAFAHRRRRAQLPETATSAMIRPTERS